MRNAIDLALVVVILIGGVLAFRAGGERMGLAAHHARLVDAAGELAVDDPTLIYLKALDTGEPLHFAWRVHLPPKTTLAVRSQMAGGSSTSTSSHSDPQELIARVRLREEAPNQVRVYTKFAGGSGTSGYDSPELARLLREHAHELKIEQIGRSEAVTITPDATKPTVLLRISIPDAIRPPDLPQWISSGNLLELSIGAPGTVP